MNFLVKKRAFLPGACSVVAVYYQQENTNTEAMKVHA